MIKLLIGGSPCTHWSVAQKNNRETTAEGTGWKLFRNFPDIIQCGDAFTVREEGWKII